jgi:hypothetical protein
MSLFDAGLDLEPVGSDLFIGTFGFYPVLGLTVVDLALNSKAKFHVSFVPCSPVGKILLPSLMPCFGGWVLETAPWPPA